MAQILDDLVPQKVGQLADFWLLLDTQTPVEQVIAVPKISQDIIPQRFVDLDPQLAELLVEVPTALSYSFIQQRIVEQNVGVPFPRTRAGGGLNGFHPGTGSSQRPEVQNADIPVPRARDNRRNPRGFHPVRAHLRSVVLNAMSAFSQDRAQLRLVVLIVMITSLRTRRRRMRTWSLWTASSTPAGDLCASVPLTTVVGVLGVRSRRTRTPLPEHCRVA